MNEKNQKLDLFLNERIQLRRTLALCLTQWHQFSLWIKVQGTDLETFRVKRTELESTAL